jgi:hypothetical protein
MVLVSSSSEDLGWLINEEPMDEVVDEELEQRSSKKARTDEGPSAVAGTSRSIGRAWLGSGSGAGARQSSIALVTAQSSAIATTQTSVPTQPALDVRRLVPCRTVAR